MIDINRKLSKDFIEIKPDINIQKAFEILSNSSANTLIIIDPNGIEFYYITNYIINQSILNKQDSSSLKAQDIAIRSIIFDYDKFNENETNYLEEFLGLHSECKGQATNLILVTSKGKPVGLLTDLEFSHLPGNSNETQISQLDEFIKTNQDPIENIDSFYNQIEQQGFKLDQDLKNYIKYLMKIHITDQENALIKSTNNRKIIPVEDKIPISTPISEPTLALIETGSSKKTKEDSSSISVIYTPNHVNHRPEASSPETPERITKIIALLKDREKVFSDKCRLISDFDPATEDDLLRVHTKQYIDFIKNYSKKGGGFLGDSTYITKFTHDLALLAVGGCIKAGEQVLSGESDFSLSLVRPPGHHATRDKYGGYCIYNNAAALARYLQAKHGLKKILILDWDAHAANGTMDIFIDDPTVMLISLHQDPHNYYPKTGFGTQMGKLQGLGYTINVEMPRGSGDQDYLKVFNELVLPLYHNYNPDFVIGCNGFDAHHSDPYTDLQLTADGYYQFHSIFRKMMIGKMVILMEGGYNPFMGELAHTILNGLSGMPKPFEDKYHSLTQKVVSSEKTNKLLNKKIKELKFNLDRYNIL